MTDYTFLGSKLTANNDCSQEIKRHLLFGRKVMTNADRVLRSRDITLPTKVCIVRAMVFPVVMYKCENWTIGKAEHRRMNAFKLWCWRRLFDSPLDSKEMKPVNPKGNQAWILIRRTDAEAELPKLWPPDAKSLVLGKTLMLGKIEGRRRRGQQRMKWLDGITDSMEMSLSKLGDSEGQGSLVCSSPWGCKESEMT